MGSAMTVSVMEEFNDCWQKLKLKSLKNLQLRNIMLNAVQSSNMTKWGIITLTRLDPLILVELPRFKIASELKKKAIRKLAYISHEKINGKHFILLS